mgnify:CR=1 FL=1
MQTLTEIRQLLAERGLRPRHRLGQNFMHDKNQVAKLVGAAALSPGDLVLEVGPGTGTLTEALLEAGARVVVSELDQGLAALIRERFDDRVTVLEGDCLTGTHTLSPAIQATLGDQPFVTVANLPYQVASPLMVLLLQNFNNCRGIYATVQLEVAQRMTATAGTKQWGPLTVMLQLLAEVERLSVVPASSFWPKPKVKSAMVALRPRSQALVEDSAAFGRFVTQLFTKRRKQLGAICPDWKASSLEFDWTRRPESLTIPELVTLFKFEKTAKAQREVS